VLVAYWVGNKRIWSVVMFADMHGFMRISEQMEPDEVLLLLNVSCPRIFWTPICPTGGIHDEVEHEPNRNQRCE